MDKKSILIGALGAALLFVAIGAGTYQDQEPKGVWELHTVPTTSSAWSINTESGEVRWHP